MNTTYLQCFILLSLIIIAACDAPTVHPRPKARIKCVDNGVPYYEADGYVSADTYGFFVQNEDKITHASGNCVVTRRGEKHE